MLLPVPPQNIQGKDTHAYWEGFLSEEDINLILSQPEWLSTGAAYVGSGGDYRVNPELRRTQVAWLGTKPELISVWNKIANTVSEVNRRYFHFDLNGFYEPIQLGIYSAQDNGHYNWHTDASPMDNNVPRKLSMSILLSDPSEFEGGDLQVKTTSDEVQTLECAKGRAWFFPSYTLHRVTPVTNGIRRSLVLWVGGPPFK